MTKIQQFDSLEYYKILDVTQDASEENIRQKYRELAKFWHPDHNNAANAMDIFQKISAAYEVLKDSKTRLKYDLLSIIYKKESFPNLNALSIIRNMHGLEDINIRAFRLKEITGKGLTHNLIDKVYFCNQTEALSVIGGITRHNWLYGFWGITAFFVNIKALLQNFISINNKKENLSLLIHNSLAYLEENKLSEAATLAIQAKNYASKQELVYLEKYISDLNTENLLTVKKWNFAKLKRIQLIYPFILLIACLLFLVCNFFINTQKNSADAKLKQYVIFENGQKIFSDVAVAKIFDVPVDVYSTQQLYHLNQPAQARHGADNDFDIYKNIETGTTVRITGYTADKKWYRVMFDNGEMAFIESDKLEQGIGNPVPLWSKIYKEE